MKTIRKKLFSAVCAGLFLPLPAKANSAIMIWQGTDVSGVVSADEECPLTVLHEDLTFQITDTPDSSFGDPDSFRDYSSTVIAAYTFHNPSDLHVSARLAFPFGPLPYYAYPRSDEDYSTVFEKEREKYRIEINGQPADVTMRYTWLYGRDYDTSLDLPLLEDSYHTDEFLRPDTPVTIFTYKPVLSEPEKASHISASAVLSGDSSEVRWMLEPFRGLTIKESRTEASVWASEEEVHLIVLGPQDPQEPSWTFTDAETDKEAEGTMVLENTETTTFLDCVLAAKKIFPDMSDHDWYNIFVGSLNASLEGSRLYTNSFIEPVRHEQIMRWYVYTLEADPGETLINSVTAPVYPDVNMGYKEPVYTYTYLLSPASTWKEFGTLDVDIRTDLHLLKTSQPGFEQTDAGHRASFEKLPEGELSFDLCTVSSPSRKNNSGWLYAMIFLVPIVLGILLFFLVLAFLLKFIFRKKA
ncbi:MAG: hypothetical protein IKG46_10360 [Solobacterium sp.]|nr:hypothetical protein [Solobacterium sp.]